MSRFEEFNPDHCTRDQMNYLADHIENYLIELERTMIIPDELLDEIGESIEEGKRRAKKLLAKLRDGKTSVFIERDDE